MSRAEPPNHDSFEARLRNLCRERGVPEGRARRLIGVVVLGQMLSNTGAGVIKGASNIEVRLGTGRTRASSDLDTVRKNALDDFRDALALALREGWGGFHGELEERGEIETPVPADYKPYRYDAKLKYKDGSLTTIAVEASREEVGSLEVVEDVASVDASVWFDEIGLPSPAAVPTMPLHHQVAQKLHACTAADTEDWRNDRVHDLVDIQLAMDLFGGELADIRETAIRLFDSRRLHEWPPTVTKRAGWEIRYATEAEELSVLQDLDEAIEWANNLIHRIDAART